MNILEQIIKTKKLQVQQNKLATPLEVLQQADKYKRTCFSLSEHVTKQGASGIIAEFKRKSPSKGFINEHAIAADVTKGYELAGASAISILTDTNYFAGVNNDVETSRGIQIPILRKEFIVDEYQIHEAKAIGADAILLIAACLTPTEVKNFAQLAIGIGLEVLLELHEESELAHVCDEIQLVGVNNRNLSTFKVDIEQSLKMAEKIPSNKIKIAESGIDAVETINMFKQAGFNGFLIGEQFMKASNPALSLQQFCNALKN
jgi:indole-3-glycerol phosphate synthase